MDKIRDLLDGEYFVNILLLFFIYYLLFDYFKIKIYFN